MAQIIRKPINLNLMCEKTTSRPHRLHRLRVISQSGRQATIEMRKKLRKCFTNDQADAILVVSEIAAKSGQNSNEPNSPWENRADIIGTVGGIITITFLVICCIQALRGISDIKSGLSDIKSSLHEVQLEMKSNNAKLDIFLQQIDRYDKHDEMDE